MKINPAPPTRREFLGTVGLATSAVLGFPAILRAGSPNEKLNLAIIGCGGRGGANLASVSGENIVALCDVNGRNLEAAAAKHPRARQYVDFRKLYDQAKDIDAVVVSCAEHAHAHATLPALQMGKHVYCEKPLTHSVWEARRITGAARAANVATQMGTQIHAGTNYRRVVELVQSGAIGAVTEVHVWVGRAWGRQSPEDAKRHHDIVSVTERPKEAQTPPPYLDWDLWLGPAPERPFHEVYFPGPKWYRWWDFGGGTMTATYEYDARGELPPVKLIWYQGEEKPAPWRERKIPQWNSGVLFIGSKGLLLSDYSKHTLLPEDRFKDFAPPPKSIPDSIGHHREWIQACKTGSPTTCPFTYSGPLTEANHLGNVAYRVGRKIIWDTAKLEVTNAPEAARIIRRPYRPGWNL